MLENHLFGGSLRDEGFRISDQFQVADQYTSALVVTELCKGKANSRASSCGGNYLSADGEICNWSVLHFEILGL